MRTLRCYALSRDGKNKTFVCPNSIKETYYKPHFDCLVYDIVHNKAFVIRQGANWEGAFVVDVVDESYNDDVINGYLIIIIKAYMQASKYK